MDSTIDESPWIDRSEPRPVDLLVPERLAPRRQSDPEDKSDRSSRFQFSRDGKLGHDHVQRVCGAVRRWADPYEKHARRIHNYGSRVCSHVVRQPGHAYVLGRCLVKRGFRLVFPVFRSVHGATNLENDGQIRGGYVAACDVAGLGESRQSYEREERRKSWQHHGGAGFCFVQKRCKLRSSLYRII